MEDGKLRSIGWTFILGHLAPKRKQLKPTDITAIKFRGVNAVTNFDITRYDVERIMASSTLLAQELAKRNKGVESNNEAIDLHPSGHNSSGEAIQESNGVAQLLKVFPRDLVSLKRAQVLCFYMGRPDLSLDLVELVPSFKN